MKGFAPCPFPSKARIRRYFVEFNYRHGDEEIYLGKINITAESTRNAIRDHKAIADWVVMALLGGGDQYANIPSALKMTLSEDRKTLSARDINTLIRWGVKPQLVNPNQAFAFDGEKCVWRVDVDYPNAGIKATLTDVTGRDRTVWVKREFYRSPRG